MNARVVDFLDPRESPQRLVEKELVRRCCWLHCWVCAKWVTFTRLLAQLGQCVSTKRQSARSWFRIASRESIRTCWDVTSFVPRSEFALSFLFVLFRVISWIACYAPRKVIHEITRNNTNEIPKQLEFLTQSRPWVDCASPSIRLPLFESDVARGERSRILEIRWYFVRSPHD